MLENGETPKQLLARCKYILARKENDWTESQKQRANLLFKYFPQQKAAYHHTLGFRNIYENIHKDVAKIAFEKWIEKVTELNLQEFNTVANTIKYNLENI